MPLATDSDAVREYAFNVGRERPDQAWILDPRDVWTQNPFYRGPAVPHPDDDERNDQDRDIDWDNGPFVPGTEVPPPEDCGSLSDKDDYEFF
jgi:hypothetical protein